jgi:hypothetical protein
MPLSSISAIIGAEPPRWSPSSLPTCSITSEFYALGLFTQLSIVFPKHDAVLAVFAAIDGSAKLLPTVWKHFPSAFESSAVPLSTDATVLGQRESQLRLLEPYSRTASPTSAKISGRVFTLSPNDQGALTVRFDFSRGAVRYSLTDDRGSHSVTSGLGRWNEQNTMMTGALLHHEYQPDTLRVVRSRRSKRLTALSVHLFQRPPGSCRKSRAMQHCSPALWRGVLILTRRSSSLVLEVQCRVEWLGQAQGALWRDRTQSADSTRTLRKCQSNGQV